MSPVLASLHFSNGLVGEGTGKKQGVLVVGSGNEETGVGEEAGCDGVSSWSLSQLRLSFPPLGQATTTA